MKNPKKIFMEYLEGKQIEALQDLWPTKLLEDDLIAALNSSNLWLKCHFVLKIVTKLLLVLNCYSYNELHIWNSEKINEFFIPGTLTGQVFWVP